jgi:hypothetical protein
MSRNFRRLQCMVASVALAMPVTAATISDSTSLPVNLQIEGDARILHALDRLTFGPRPGDFSAVKAIGLEAWIQKQLHPESIDDSALQAKLELYPAMHMTVKDLLEKLPPPPVIRQVMLGKFAMPDQPDIQAVYQTQIAQYQLRQQARAERQDAGQPAQSQNAAAAAPGQSQPQPGPAPTDATTNPPPSAGAGSDPLAEQRGDRVQPGDPGLADKTKQIMADLQATSIANLPPQERMAKLLAMGPVERISFHRDLSLEDRLAFVQGLTPRQSQLFSAMFSPRFTVVSQLEATKMLRVTESERQLQEVMTDFWLDHFNVDVRKNALMPYYLVGYENNVLRPHALGNFEDLLVATAQSPAMMLYLDNASSVGPDSSAAMQARNAIAKSPDNKRVPPGLNENYARELMELQTLGVDGGYTQQDVIEVAKVFSGWTVERPVRGGGFVFNPRRHQPGAKLVLGHTIADQGEAEGLQVLHLLANSPATAHHISEELAERFVSDRPPQTLVDRMAQTFLASHGDIRQVLHTMFVSPEFWSQATLHAKIKTPLQYVASAVRASNTQVQYPVVLASAVARLGMPLYACQPPTGYSFQGDAWVGSGSLVERMNFAMAFAYNRLPGVINHWDALLGDDAAALPTSQKESLLERALLHGNISPKTQDAVMKDLVDAPLQPMAHPFPLGRGPGSGYIVPVAAQPASPSATADGSLQPNVLHQPLPRDGRAALSAGLLLGSPDFQTY